MDTIGFYRINEVEIISGLSRRNIYQQMANGNFPTSVVIAGNSKGWLKQDIHDWVLKVLKENKNIKL